jgi:hypothetical protein
MPNVHDLSEWARMHPPDPAASLEAQRWIYEQTMRWYRYRTWRRLERQAHGLPDDRTPDDVALDARITLELAELAAERATESEP